MSIAPRKLLPWSSLLTLSLMSATPVSAAESTNVLHFPVNGFSIATLEAAPGATMQQPLIMCLPAGQGFAANVNVQIQPFSRTIEEDKEITLGQFKARDMKVIAAKVGGNSELLFEYSGQYQSQTLHWYARALKSGDHVYLVTATGLAQQWTEQGPQLKHCVDSFKCEAAAR